MMFASLTALNAIGRPRSVEMNRLLFQVVVELAQGADVVQNPEGPAMGRNYKVIIFDHQIVNRCSRKVELERSPRRAIVEGDVDTPFCSRIKHSALFRVYTNSANETTVGNSIRQFAPRLSIVAGLIDVGAKIVVLVAIDRNVSRARIQRRSINLADTAPLRHVLRRHVCPVLTFITRNLDEPVISANPDQAFRDRRFGDRKDRVVILGPGVVQRNLAARGLLLAPIVTREVRADRLPMHSAIGGPEQTLATVIESVGVVRRNHHWSGPLESMLDKTGAI